MSGVQKADAIHIGLSPTSVSNRDRNSLHRLVVRRHSLPTVKVGAGCIGSGDSRSAVESPDSGTVRSSLSSFTSTSSAHPDQGDQSDAFCGPRISYYVNENKSRLPCGIDRIRPHLQNVDNVPLQVSLFTDCSTASIQEMIRIRQEYGETVCVVGSTYSVDSLRLMHCADVAVAIRPELPKPCEAFIPNGNEEYHTGSKNQINQVRTSCSKSAQHSNPHSDQFITERVPLIPPPCTSQTQTVSDLVNALELTARLVCSLSPGILNLNKSGFCVHESIHEVRHRCFSTPV
ncbi:unnamed protein product [Echinostoma caproni]|uniref:ANF_receptor domain-containing protein n=1 Tax=Echinostoma caproni TaxID=27848 RepID=A0A183BB69_9TREM|nr:unnamed protein product [Echinostoma caproni]